ncbi:hypothetical protein CTAYLR_010809 [Chrysophaeum taylorii]|uniref:Protein kinase domain-containing protein n=1 Tax=Chrysophaeum taylorii TaxID=2483200 RepID=A0AAD7UH45_9STRA|nr:hypothetical protein CTAYLR_010809 [Chrysophaeum taylorii]
MEAVDNLEAQARELRARAAAAQQRRVALTLDRAAASGAATPSEEESEFISLEAELTKAALLAQAEAEAARVRANAREETSRLADAARQVRELREQQQQEMERIQAALVGDIVGGGSEQRDDLSGRHAQKDTGYDSEKEEEGGILPPSATTAYPSDDDDDDDDNDDAAGANVGPLEKEDASAAFEEIPWAELNMEDESWLGRWRGEAVIAAPPRALGARELLVLKAIAHRPDRLVGVLGYTKLSTSRWALVSRAPIRLVRDLSPDEMRSAARVVLRDVARGLEAIADLGLVHRGVAPPAVGDFGGDSYKLVDFDLTRSLAASHYFFDEPNALPEAVVRYAAAETLEFGTWSAKSDVWAAAALSCQMLDGGTRPFDDLHPDASVRPAVVAGRRPAPPANVPPYLAMLLRDCFLDDPNARPFPADLARRADAIEEGHHLPVFRVPSAPPWRPSFDEDPGVPDEANDPHYSTTTPTPQGHQRHKMWRTPAHSLVHRFRRTIVTAARHYAAAEC